MKVSRHNYNLRLNFPLELLIKPFEFLSCSSIFIFYVEFFKIKQILENANDEDQLGVPGKYIKIHKTSLNVRVCLRKVKPGKFLCQLYVLGLDPAQNL